MRQSSSLLLSLALALSASAAKNPKPPKMPVIRSPHEQAKHEFEAAHPCPSTGRSSGQCPGFVVGYLTPLGCGGADTAMNMRWVTPEQNKAAKKTERHGCNSAAG